MKKHEVVEDGIGFFGVDEAKGQILDFLEDIFDEPEFSAQDQELVKILHFMAKDEIPETPLLSEQTWARMHAAIAMQNPANRRALSD
jgi:hypothetical protein